MRGGQCIWLIFAALCLAPTASAKVTVTRQPIELERRTFDPAKAPAEMPHLSLGEAAVTASEFHIQSQAAYEMTEHPLPDGTCRVDARVTDVRITVRVRIVIWLPNGATAKLSAHEEGHRRIVEKIYQDRADRAAQKAGRIMDGRTFTGEGADCQAAAGHALDPRTQEVGQTWLSLTSNVSKDINDRYDAITHHGTNSVPEDKAIAEAFDQYAADHPAPPRVLEGARSGD